MTACSSQETTEVKGQQNNTSEVLKGGGGGRGEPFQIKEKLTQVVTSRST